MPDNPQPSGIGGTLKSKWGPLPVWGWLLIVTALAVGYYLYSRRSSQKKQAPPSVGHPGVVVINQGDTNLPGTAPPRPPEDHDKDDEDERRRRRRHDDDDHHRHRKRRREREDEDEAERMVTSHQPAPFTQPGGQFFPKAPPPGAGEGGSAAGEGSGGRL